MRLVEVARAKNFDELVEVIPDITLPKGDPLRIVLELNLPVAKAFDLPGAELIFEPVMPEGLILEDVYGVGAWKVVIDCRVDPVGLPAVAAWLAANWKILALLAIGIPVALGLLVASVAILVLAIRAPEVFLGIFIGVGAVATAFLLPPLLEKIRKRR